MVKEYLSHVSQEISQEIEDYVTDVVFKKSRYIFTTRDDGEEKGYCTHCKAEFETNKLKHNSRYTCPNCGSECIVKQAWRGHKHLIDKACFLWYEKSIEDSSVLVARGFYVERYYGDYENVCNMYGLEAAYIFADKPKMLKKYWWNHEWYETKSIYSFNINSLGNIPYFCNYDNIKKVIEGTRFKYAPYKNFLEGDMLKFFELYNKYPIIEQLTKAGLGSLINHRLQGSLMYNSVYWKGKDIFKAIRLSRGDLKEINTAEVALTPLFLKIYQDAKKDKSNLTSQEVKYLEYKSCDDYDRLKSLSKYTKLRKIYKYMKKQDKVNKKDKYRSDLSTWDDYLNDCEKLNWDITNDSVLFPKNLYTAHQNTIVQIKIKADEKINDKIAKRLKALNKKYYFEYKGLLIRPANDSIELLEEGKALTHCVGGYAQRYADGTTNILFIRKLSEPDKPYYTMEVFGNDIRQTRGLRNCAPTQEVKEFIEAFCKAKLNKKPRVKIPA